METVTHRPIRPQKQEAGLLLVGDIGGTKTDLAIISEVTGIRTHLARTRFASRDYPDLDSMIHTFLASTALPVRGASFSVAGPVIGGRARLTNLPWDVDAHVLRRTLDLPTVWVLNDLAAIAQMVPLLRPDDQQLLNQGTAVAGGAIAVIAPGTGLGEAFLTWDGNSYQQHPSEGGHADFAPPTPELVALLPYLQNRLGHVSYENVCSGRGIPYLYQFFRDTGDTPETPELAAQLAKAEDPTPLIIDSALDKGIPSKTCQAVLDAFVTILAAEAGNLALKTMATGGVFLAGGIPPRILPILTSPRFMRIFQNKGRFSGILENIPVHVIVNTDVALLGAACFALSGASGAVP